MKKIIISAVIALSGIASANAQFYIGGSLGYSSTTIKQEGWNNRHSSSFAVAPLAGYCLKGKLDIGLSAFANFSVVETPFQFMGMNNILQTKTQEFLLAPYFRYSVVKWNKVTLSGTATIYAGKGKTSVEKNEFMEGTETEYTSWGANIYPTVVYDLSDKIAVFSDLNFLKFGFSQTKIKDGDTTSGFIFALNAINASIGFMYKF